MGWQEDREILDWIEDAVEGGSSKEGVIWKSRK